MIKVYDPKRITMSLAGLLINKGFAEDAMIKVVRTSVTFESQAGVDGEVTRNKLYDKRGEVTVSLMSSSEANDQLSALHNRDENSPNGAGVGAFQLKDLNGTTLISGTSAWIKGWPEQEFGKKASVRAWIIEVADLRGTIGGNIVAAQTG